MKKGFCLILSMLLLALAGAALADEAVIDGGEKGTILFSVPKNDTSKAIGRYYNGTQAELFSIEEDWANVKIGDSEGYVLANNLKMDEKAEDVQPQKISAVVTADDYVNLRRQPSTNAKVVRRLSKGVEIRILGELPGRWRYVQAGDDFGYVLEHFIKTYGVDLGEAVVKTDGANVLLLYKKPDTKSEMLGLFYEGTAVKVLAKKGEWRRVRIGQQEGYARAEYLEPKASNQVPTPEYRTGKVQSPSGLNLRPGPSSKQEKIRTLKDGTFVYVMGETQTGWYYVMVGEDFGYVNSKYIQMDND